MPDEKEKPKKTRLTTRRCKVCPICGKHFIAKVYNQVYCSIPCRRRSEGKCPDEEWRQGRTCIICGKEFLPRNSKQRTCSFDCSEENKMRLRAIRSGHKTDFKATTIDEDGDGLDIEQYNRRCHDCGRPTNDYRCASCRRKWLKKNKVNLV